MPNWSWNAAPRRTRVKKNALAAELVREVDHDIEALLGRQSAEDLDLEALETTVRQQVLALAGRILQRQLNADTSDYSGPRRRCACRAPARYAGRRAKRVHTALGCLQLERAYYHCAARGHGWFPRDRAGRIEDCSFSPAVVRLIATVGALVSFQEGSQLLAELAAVAVEPKQVERMRYPQFEADGLCTGSGVVEAGCKVVVGTRLKRAGMRWTLDGANAIIALRCSKLSGRFQDFWERRSSLPRAA